MAGEPYIAHADTDVTTVGALRGKWSVAFLVEIPRHLGPGGVPRFGRHEEITVVEEQFVDRQGVVGSSEEVGGLETSDTHAPIGAAGFEWIGRRNETDQRRHHREAQTRYAGCDPTIFTRFETAVAGHRPHRCAAVNFRAANQLGWLEVPERRL